MDRIIVIEAGSEAFEELRKALAHSATYKISFEVRSGGIAVKTNEHMWTPALALNREPGE